MSHSLAPSIPTVVNPDAMMPNAVFHVQFDDAENVCSEVRSPFAKVIVKPDMLNRIEKPNDGLFTMSVAIGELPASVAKHLGIALLFRYQIEKELDEELLSPKIAESPEDEP